VLYLVLRVFSPFLRRFLTYALRLIMVIEAPCGRVKDREQVKKYMKSYTLTGVSVLPSCHIATKAFYL
jgi:hypothetical protein